MNRIIVFFSTMASLLVTCSAVAAVFLEGYPELNALTQVTDDGKIKIVTLNATSEISESIDTGSNRPSVAPNLHAVALIRDNNLWVKNLSTDKAQKLSQFASPNPMIEVTILAWSPDSQQILYSVQPVEFMDDDPPPVTKQHKVDHGFYLYHLATNVSRPIQLSHRFLAWLDNEHFLLLETSPKGDKLWSWQRGNLKELTKQPIQGLGQVTLSADRQWLVASTGAIGNSSQIVKINLQTGEVVKVGPVGAFTEYQWPIFSPSGKQVATLWRKKGSPQASTQLLVDGRLVWSAADDYRWVNDHLVAVRNSCGLSIVKVESGKRIAYYPKLKTKAEGSDVAQGQPGIKCD